MEAAVPLILLIIGIGLLYLLTRGAPYVPTHQDQVLLALDLLDVPAGGCIVDLGSGDGVLLEAAAKRGIRAVGYEINPLLWLISKWRTRRYAKYIRIELSDYWHVTLPDDVDAIFVFSASLFIERLERKLQAEATRLSSSIKVASYGFTLPHYKPIKQREGVTVYVVEPSLQA